MKKSHLFTVHVQTSFVPEQFEPEHNKYVWSYEVTITNQSQDIVQLLSRFWKITDLTGKVDEIHGVGVIGLQPLIKPGKKFVYVSYCQLSTPQGTMEGHYEMQDLNDNHFDVDIPKFILSAPSAITKSFKAKLH